MRKIVLFLLLIIFSNNSFAEVDYWESLGKGAPPGVLYYSEAEAFNNWSNLEKREGYELNIDILNVEKDLPMGVFVTYEVTAKEDVYIFDVENYQQKCPQEFEDELSEMLSEYGRDGIEWKYWQQYNSPHFLMQSEEDLYVQVSTAMSVGDCISGFLYTGGLSRSYLLSKGSRQIATINILHGRDLQRVNLIRNDIQKAFLGISYIKKSDLSDLDLLDGYLKQYEKSIEEMSEEERDYYRGISEIENGKEFLSVWNWEWLDDIQKTAIIEIPLNQAVEVPTPRKPGYWERIKAMQKRVWARRR